jgi:hypothetical protein
MSTIGSYYLGMAIVVTTIFGLTLAYQSIRYNSHVRQNNAAEE